MTLFKSDRFRPFLPGDRQVNPNVFGFELASWLSQSLAEHRVVTSYPSEEDWGWYLIFPEGEAEYQVCCSGSEESPGEYEWRVFVSPIKRLLRRRPSDAMAEELFESILDCLKESGIAVSVEPL
jgi:hypothetical protein